MGAKSLMGAKGLSEAGSLKGVKSLNLSHKEGLGRSLAGYQPGPRILLEQNMENLPVPLHISVHVFTSHSLV
jgi:hypothetical protein